MLRQPACASPTVATNSYAMYYSAFIIWYLPIAVGNLLLEIPMLSLHLPPQLQFVRVLITTDVQYNWYISVLQ